MADYETRRFSRIEYERMIDLGVSQPAHYTAIVTTAKALQAAFVVIAPLLP